MNSKPGKSDKESHNTMSDQTLTDDKKYKAWLYWLKRIGFYRRVWKEDIVLCPKSWKSYFDEGLRVGEALKEDLNNA